MLVLLAAVLMRPAHAQLNTLSPEFSAGFSFFKFAKVQPVFEDWVRSSPRYAAATPRERVHMLRVEPNLLASRFDSFVPSQNAIELRMKARIFVPGRKRAEDMITREGVAKIPVKLKGYEDGFFPLEVAEMWIALTPINLDDLINLRLNKEQYNQFKTQASGTSLSTGTEASIRMTFVPSGADTTQPLKKDGFELWMLHGTLVEFEIWDVDNKRIIWVYEAEGHKAPPKQGEIFNLYE